MGQGVGRLEPLILDHGAAFVGVTNGPDVCHTQGVTQPLLPTEVLLGGERARECICVCVCGVLQASGARGGQCARGSGPLSIT